MIEKESARELAQTVIAALLALLFAAIALEVWRADLRVPLERQGDGLLHSVMVQGVIEEGWPLTIDRAGAPGELDFRDFPAADNFSLLIIRLLGFFIRDYAILINVFFLLTFPMAGAAAFIVSRRLGLSLAASYPVAILYPLLPYHFGRAIGHLFLSSYAVVPFATLVAVRIATGAQLFSRANRRLTALTLLFCAILGSSGVYYPFFACLFITLAGLSGSLTLRNWAPIRTAAAIAAIVLAVLVVNHLPSIIKDFRHGSLGIASRVPAEVEHYGLKISQLILPVTDHRIPKLAHLRERYNRGPLRNENDMSTLGLFGTAGFVLLLFWLFWRKPAAREMNSGNPVLNHLSVLNAGGVLYGTIGGLASIFALLISPQIRSVNRISVFIAFFSMVAAGMILDRLLRGRPGWVAALAAATIAILGALDQTSRQLERFHGDEALFHQQREYVRRIEAILPSDASVFQLPYFPFPENGPIEVMDEYEHFRPYLLSRTTEWSYGAVRGSVGDLWQREVASLPAIEMVRVLVQAGFDGIWIDRRGYADRAAALEQELALLTGATPIASEKGDSSFVPLQLARYRISKQMDRRQWDAESRDAVGRFLVSWRSGFSRPEIAGESEWRWGSRRGELVVHNPGGVPREALVRFRIETGRDEPSELEIESAFWNETLDLGSDAAAIERRVTIPPGSHRLRLRATAEPIQNPTDPRVLVFQLRDFEVAPPAPQYDSPR